MPPEASYTFIHYGFAGEPAEPQLTLWADDAEGFTHFAPRGQEFTLTFDTAQRFCAGWHDLATNQSLPCPDTAQLPTKYQQCRRCMAKTGFNPAFYNANSVSPQQQARNAEPHLLYLAHFGPGVVKVGISHAKRGINRLLDQGARSGVVIKTYPNADIARQYEAKIATLAGIAESIQPRKKHQLLLQPYDAASGTIQLQAARQRLIDELGITPDSHDIAHFDTYYLSSYPLEPEALTDTTPVSLIAGQCIGMIGGRLICRQGERQYVLPLTTLIGYRVALQHTVAEQLPSPPQQARLF